MATAAGNARIKRRKSGVGNDSAAREEWRGSLTFFFCEIDGLLANSITSFNLYGGRV